MDEDIKPGDVLRGCPRITSFIRILLDDENITEGQCYHWLEEQYIPNTKFGGQIVTTKSRIIGALAPPPTPQPKTRGPGRPPNSGRK
jgi:hypothetical protein